MVKVLTAIYVCTHIYVCAHILYVHTNQLIEAVHAHLLSICVDTTLELLLYQTEP